ncbi:MAG: ribulose-phosphate 3-epimerase [bacterium]
MHIYPAILTEDKKELEKMLNLAETFCKNVHLDIMDGLFVPTKSISYNDLPKTSLFTEIHLMVNVPLDYVDGFKQKGAGRIIFHFEGKDNPKEVIKKIKKEGMEVGISLNPETAISNLFPFFDEIDLVLIMSVIPGFYGSKFIPEVLNKAEKLKKEKPSLMLEMDGGIKTSNISLVKEVGIDIAAVGSEIFLSENPALAYERLTKI